MKLERLTTGMKIPNYRKLCELMDEPEKSGASKRAQISEWERYFSYERSGNAFIIKEIYDVPAMSQDGRKKYMQYVEPLLLHALNNYGIGFGEIEHTFSAWCIALGLTSERVYDEKVEDEYQTLVSAGYGKAEPLFSTIAIRRAKYEITRRAKDAFLSAAQSLQKKGIISCSNKTYIVQNQARKLANEEEVRYIVDTKQRVLKEMQLSSMFYVQMSPKRLKAYYERLRELYRTERGWTKTYDLYAVTGLDWQRIAAHTSVDLDALRDGFKKEVTKAIDEKLEEEVKKGEEVNERLFDMIGEGVPIDKNTFTMDRMLATDIEHLVSELL